VIKGSWLYDAYWTVADRSLVEQRRQEFNFFRKTLVGFRRNDLIFDIGANHGLKAEIFLKLGARVIAVDPDVSNQKTLTERFLALRLRKKPIVIVAKAVSARNGHETFWVSEPGFEINTLSAKWAETLGKDPARFGRIMFEFREKRQVETITLEQMISTYGRPFYIKIDMEGYELNVLKGLQTAVPYLSFEVNLPYFRSEGEQCTARLREIAADGVFNCAVGGRLMFSDWMSHDNFAKAFARSENLRLRFFGEPRFPRRCNLEERRSCERASQTVASWKGRAPGATHNLPESSW
jgi:FkbM family methyltransferase